VEREKKLSFELESQQGGGGRRRRRNVIPAPPSSPNSFPLLMGYFD